MNKYIISLGALLFAVALFVSVPQASFAQAVGMPVMGENGGVNPDWYHKMPHCDGKINYNLPIAEYYPTGLHAIPFKNQPRPTLEGCDQVNGTAKYFKQIFEDKSQVIVSDWYRLDTDNDHDRDDQCKPWQAVINPAYPDWGYYLTPGHTYCVTNTVYKKLPKLMPQGDGASAEQEAISQGKAQVVEMPAAVSGQPVTSGVPVSGHPTMSSN